MTKITVKGKSYTVVTLDFETYYDVGYTLSGKINTSEYIRDARFHVHGVGIKIGDKKTKWYTGRNIALALSAIDWKKHAVLAHNTPFDGFILSEVYGHKPAFYLDTLAMARAAHGHHTRHDLDTIAKLHGRGGKTKRSALANTKGKTQLTKAEERALGGYCIDDVDDCNYIFWKILPYIPEDELRLIDITCRMFCDAVLRVDMQRVEDELKAEVGGKVAALLTSGAQISDLMSNNKFAELLKLAGATVPIKISPSTGLQTYAFARNDLSFQELAKCGNPKVEALCDARLKVKSTIGETRAERFLEAGKDGKNLPVLLNYAGAHTLRWSGGNKLNLQNLKRGGELRKSILAPEGHYIVVADSAQIEARVCAWLAGQDDVLQNFASGRDNYKVMASAIWNIPEDQVTKEQRFIGKICVLGLGFGMGAVKLQLTLKQGIMGPPVDISLTDCYRIVKIYRSRNWKIPELWKTMDEVIFGMMEGIPGTIGPCTFGKGYLCLPNGLFLQYYGLRGQVIERPNGLSVSDVSYATRNNGRGKLYGGLLTENVVQALARIIISEQMLKIHDAGYRIVTMTHDEVVCVVPKKDAQKCLDFMLQTLSTPPDWAPDLPLAAEGGFDDCYSK